MSNKQTISNEKKNILILSPFFSPNIGGVETHLDDLCDFLAEEEWNVHVLTYRPLTTKTEWQHKEQHKNISITRIWWPSGLWFHKFEGKALLQFLYLVPRLFIATFFYLLKHKNIKIIHTHGLSAAFIGKILKPVFKFKLFFSSHAIYEMYQSNKVRDFVTKILKSCDHIFALSEPSKEEFLKMNIPSDNISIYRHWINLDNFKPIDQNKKVALRKKWNVPSENIIALFIGRLIEKKGIKTVLDLVEEFPNITFIIAGNGQLTDEVRNKEKEFNNLYFPGFINTDKSFELYQLSDILLVPSQYEEGFGRVLIEGMASGLQIIASNMGAIPIVLRGTPALIIKPNIENFTTSLQQCINKQDSLPDISKNMQLYAQDKYSKNNGHIFTDAYQTT